VSRTIGNDIGITASYPECLWRAPVCELHEERDKKGSCLLHTDLDSEIALKINDFCLNYATRAESFIAR
jgi:hypothetical protein